MNRIAVGYTRVSTDEQAASGYGLVAQEERIRAYAKAMSIDLAEVVADDGYSGAALDRPGLVALLERIQAGEVATVVIAKLDRLSRSLRNLLNLYADEFEKNGVALVSVAEQFDTSTSSGRLFFQMVGSFAEFERNVITERTSGGRKEKARKGGYSGGKAPVGYRAVRGQKTLSVDPDGARLVRRAFELRDMMPKATLQTLADHLNAEGYKSPQGAVLRPVQVKRILDRRAFYEGQYRYAGIEAEGQHAALLGKAAS